MDNQDNITGAYIKHLRDSEELTLEQLGDLVSLSKQRLSTMENGLIGKSRNLKGIAGYFGKSVDELINDAQEWHKSEEEKKSGPSAFVKGFRQDDSTKLLSSINENLSRIVEMMEGQQSPGRSLRLTTANEPHYESTELHLDIPPAPENLNSQQIQQYDCNAGLLLRWARTESARAAFPDGVPGYALTEFCKGAVGFYGGGWAEDVTGLLKDLIEEGRK